MNRSSLFSIVGLAAVSVTLAFTQAPPDKQPASKPPAKPAATPPAGEAPQLPPGWTEADMQACIEAGTPGEMHAHLAEGIGVWNGKSTMWMAPGAPPMQSECVSTCTPMMDGRYIKCEIEGDMPGMGPFQGFGIYGYDNVSKKFQSTWIDNCSTGQMVGTGELSSDDKTMTWTFSYHCPITKKPVTMREVERITGKDTKTMEMYGIDPKSNKEYKMMEIAFTRKPGSAAAAGSH
jgi:hypothetical protein